MELSSVIMARSVWLFDINDLNPQGKSVVDLLDWLKESYRFKKAPSSMDDFDESKALAFISGEFSVRQDVLEVSLKIYNDGILGETRSSTDDSDAFLAEVLNSASKEFGLSYRPEIIRKKLYNSELNIRTAAILENLHPGLARIAHSVSEKLGTPLPFNLCGLFFAPDPTTTQGAIPFRFERRINTGFCENRYYSTAPLKTTDHLTLLNELEDLLMKVRIAE